MIESEDKELVEELRNVKNPGHLKKIVRLKKFQFKVAPSNNPEKSQYPDLFIEPRAHNGSPPQEASMKTTKSVSSLIQTKSGSLAIIKKQRPLHLINRSLVMSRQNNQRRESQIEE